MPLASNRTTLTLLAWTTKAAMTEYVICYDIHCPRRLGRIHRTLKSQAMALQYSVFLFNGTQVQLQRCLEQLERLMDKQEDDIRAYPLPARGLRWCLGQPVLPEGIYWSGLAQSWHRPHETVNAA